MKFSVFGKRSFEMFMVNGQPSQRKKHNSVMPLWPSFEVSRKKYTNMGIYNLDNSFIYKPFSSVQVLQIMCLTRVLKRKTVSTNLSNLWKDLTDNKKAVNGVHLFFHWKLLQWLQGEEQTQTDGHLNTYICKKQWLNHIQDLWSNYNHKQRAW